MAGNERAEHGDPRWEQRHQQYGDLADLTVDQLQERAAGKGIDDRSRMDKDQLMEALSKRGG